MTNLKKNIAKNIARRTNKRAVSKVPEKGRGTTKIYFQRIHRKKQNASAFVH